MINVVVRDTTDSDLCEIFRIRMDPDVAPHQYPILKDDTMEKWRQRIAGDNVDGPFTIRHSTVLFDDLIVGHIIHHHYEVSGTKYACCGWNLDPRYWGRGLMALALRQKFNEFFVHENIEHIFSDCFPNNKRCIRLMNRLGYVRQNISISERIITAYSTRCLKWIIRFRLDLTRWESAK